jgi:glucose dehydrogenase
MGTVDNRLLALDASTGTPCPGFADDGQINLSQGLGEVMRGHHYISSPPAVIGDIAVVGSFILDNQSTRQPPGVVRAYNVHSGELVWAWDVLQATAHPPLKEGQSYPRNTANVWSLMSVDEDLGLIYLPTGNVPPDFFGGFRSPEQDRYPSSVVALEAATGDVRWSFQTVHHDIWD